MSIKYARPETAFVTQKFIKNACTYLQMKYMSRYSYPITEKTLLWKFFSKSVSPMWRTYRESSTSPKIKAWYSGPFQTNISVWKVYWLNGNIVLECKV